MPLKQHFTCWLSVELLAVFAMCMGTPMHIATICMHTPIYNVLDILNKEKIILYA